MALENMEENRYSDDGDTIRASLTTLLESGKITINDVLVFFNFACGAYKQASRAVGASDAKINIEFNYASRAFASYIKDTSEKDKQLALLDAFQASRHIINDSLDLILGEIERHLIMSFNISEDITISEYIENFETLFAEKEKIHAIVAESRRKRGTFRYEAYIEIIENESYTNLINFLAKIKQAMFKLGRSREKQERRNRRDVIFFICATFLALLFGFIGLMIGFFPKEFEDTGKEIKNQIITPIPKKS
jgi:hypothetical protein